jgi:hypothetical protein
VLIDPVVPSREACHADPNRARPPFPGAPIAGDVFAYSEHAVGRAGCTGARLVGEVKGHCVLEEWFEVAAGMTLPSTMQCEREVVSLEQSLASQR